MKLSRQSLNIKFSYLAENSKFSRLNSYFSILTFLRDGFLNSCFQNPNENSAFRIFNVKNSEVQDPTWTKHFSNFELHFQGLW